MYNHFKNNFQTLIESTISDAQVRLREQGTTYQKNAKRMANIHEELEILLSKEDIQPSIYHLDLVREYFQMDAETYCPEHTATYIQAIFDCIKLLVNFGWIK